MINLLLAINGKTRGRRTRRVSRAVKPSRRAEVAYRDDLLGVVAEIRRAVGVHILPVLKDSERDYARMARDGYAGDIINAFNAMAERLGGVSMLSTRMAALAVERAKNDADKSLASSLRRSLGVDVMTTVISLNVRPQIEAAVASNAELIKGLPAQAIERIKGKVLLNVSQGRRFEVIAKEIEVELGATERRAKLIARDQTAKINAAITEAKQKALGITTYVWETAGDERVRESHAGNDGKEFNWDDPPETGHPGEEINCRCVARPVISFEDD